MLRLLKSSLLNHYRWNNFFAATSMPEQHEYLIFFYLYFYYDNDFNSLCDTRNIVNYHLVHTCAYISIISMTNKSIMTFLYVNKIYVCLSAFTISSVIHSYNQNQTKVSSICQMSPLDILPIHVWALKVARVEDTSFVEYTKVIPLTTCFRSKCVSIRQTSKQHRKSSLINRHK